MDTPTSGMSNGKMSSIADPLEVDSGRVHLVVNAATADGRKTRLPNIHWDSPTAGEPPRNHPTRLSL
jgi:hypothetical protein